MKNVGYDTVFSGCENNVIYIYIYIYIHTHIQFNIMVMYLEFFMILLVLLLRFDTMIIVLTCIVYSNVLLLYLVYKSVINI